MYVGGAYSTMHGNTYAKNHGALSEYNTSKMRALDFTVFYPF